MEAADRPTHNWLTVRGATSCYQHAGVPLLSPFLLRSASFQSDPSRLQPGSDRSPCLLAFADAVSLLHLLEGIAHFSIDDEVEENAIARHRWKYKDLSLDVKSEKCDRYDHR